MPSKTQIIHVMVDGTNGEHISNFAELVDKARNDPSRLILGTQFFVTSLAGRTGVAMTAIMSYADAAPADSPCW